MIGSTRKKFDSGILERNRRFFALMFDSKAFQDETMSLQLTAGGGKTPPLFNHHRDLGHLVPSGS